MLAQFTNLYESAKAVYPNERDIVLAKRRWHVARPHYMEWGWNDGYARLTVAGEYKAKQNLPTAEVSTVKKDANSGGNKLMLGK